MFKKEEVRGKHAAHAKSTIDEKKAEEAAGQEGAAASESLETVKMDAVSESDAAEQSSSAEQVASDTTEKAPTVTPDLESLPAPATKAIPAVTPPLAAQPTQVNPVTPAGTDTPTWTPINPDELHKSHTGRNVGIALGVIAGVILVAYIAGFAFFSGHFYPGTSISGHDVSMKNQGDVAEVVNEIASDYSIEVSGEGLDFTVSSQEMGIQVDGNNVAQKALAANDPASWPLQVNKSHDITEYMVTEYNAGGLEEAVTTQVETWNEDAEDPIDATLTYDEDSNSYTIVPEQPGTKFDVEQVLAVVDQAVAEMAPTAQLTEDQLTKPAILSDNEDLLSAQETANGYVQADLHLILGDSSEVAEINADQISEWVTFDDDMSVSFDSETMDGWLTELGNSFDTVGSERTYTRPDGKSVTVDGGTYGWEVDTPAMVELVHEEIMNGTQGEVYVPWIAGAAYYYGPGEVDWADYIDVDLSEQHAYYFDSSGDVLWESDTITGAPDGKHDTPTGIWTLFSMESPAVLKGEIQATTGAPEYETKVQYWMPFTYSGCGLHDATWQSAFGGSLYSQGFGSHGCVNLPYDAAESLYGIASVGIPVIVHW